jgi:hypothetical protein
VRNTLFKLTELLNPDLEPDQRQLKLPVNDN